MAHTGRFGQSDDFRREELIRVIEHSVENLTLQELEALYYDMSTKNYSPADCPIRWCQRCHRHPGCLGRHDAFKHFNSRITT